jgi:hypothetical protein
MAVTYTVKGPRRYRYYVCRSVRRKDWGACPTKSVAANRLECSVVAHLKIALESQEVRTSLYVPATEWASFQAGQVDSLVRSIVRMVTFNGERGEVSLKLKEFSQNQETVA